MSQKVQKALRRAAAQEKSNHIDWRTPAIPGNIRDNPEKIRFINGRWVQDYIAAFSKTDIERFRMGYLCLRCWEPHEKPFPSKCNLCGYLMQKLQRQDFQETFDGEEWIGSRLDLKQELDRVDEIHARNIHRPQATIFVPDWADI